MVLWRIFDRKIIVIGSLWLESRTVVGYLPRAVFLWEKSKLQFGLIAFLSVI